MPGIRIGLDVQNKVKSDKNRDFHVKNAEVKELQKIPICDAFKWNLSDNRSDNLNLNLPGAEIFSGRELNDTSPRIDGDLELVPAFPCVEVLSFCCSHIVDEQQ